MPHEYKLQAGAPAPAFTLENQDGAAVSLGDLAGSWVVLYMYPKDNTPGCTIEAIEFTRELDTFTASGATVLGLSPDSCASHVKFRAKHGLEVTLLSDPEHKVIDAYDGWRLKKRFGREYFGVARSTVLIDPQGNVAHHWKAAKSKGHAVKVYERLMKLKG